MKTNGFKIERGIKPPRRMAHPTSWPFKEMKIGDSFVVPNDDITAVRSAATQVKRRSDGAFNYTTRRVEGGYRFWRIAPEPQP